MAVSLGKRTDHLSIYRHRVGNYGSRMFAYLSQWSGPLSDQTREDLARNDLRGLDNLFYLITNDPSPGQ